MPGDRPHIEKRTTIQLKTVTILCVVLAAGLVASARESGQSVEGLAEALSGQDVFERRDAAISLGRMGAEAEAAIPSLASALTDGDDDVRQLSARALGRIGAAAKPAAPDLRKLLKDNVEQVRVAAAEALWGIDGRPDEVLSILIEALESEELFTSTAAATALGHMAESARPAVGELRKLLAEKEFGLLRADAASALWKIEGSATEALPTLTALLEYPDVETQMAAVQALAEMGPAAKPAVPALVQLLENPPEGTAVEPTTPSPETQEQLQRLQTEMVEAVKRSDLERLEELNEKIIELTKSPARASTSAEEKEANTWATAAGQNKDNDWGSGEAATSSTDSDLLTAAVTAVREIEGDEAALPILLEIAISADPVVSLEAVNGMAGMGAAALPSLFDALEGSDQRRRAAAILTLRQMPVTSKEVVRRLARTLDANQPLVRAAGIEMLSRAGPIAKPALPRLLDLLSHDHPSTRLDAAEAVWNIAGRADDVLPVLTGAMKDDSATVRRRAAFSLGDMGRSAQSAIPLLKSALGDKSPEVRFAAYFSLRRLGVQVEAPTTGIADLPASQFTAAAEGKSTQTTLAEHRLWAETPAGKRTRSPFSIKATKLYFTWKLHSSVSEPIEARWIAADTIGGAPKNFLIASSKSEMHISSGQFSLSSPTNGFPAGHYRLELWQSGKLLHSEEFRMLTSTRVRLVVGGDADLSDKLESCMAAELRKLPAVELDEEKPHYALNVVAKRTETIGGDSQNVISFVFLGVESEWFREAAEGKPLLEFVLLEDVFSLRAGDHHVAVGPSGALEKQCRDVVEKFYIDHVKAGRNVAGAAPMEFFESVLPKQ